MPNNIFTRHKARTLSFILGLLVVGILFYVYRGNLNRESLQTFSEGLPVYLVLSAFLILPLCGVPIRIMLALTDLPFRIYAGIGAPIYILLSVVPIGVGSAVTDFNMKWFYLLATGFGLTLILGVWLKKHYSPEQMLKTGA